MIYMYGVDPTTGNPKNMYQESEKAKTGPRTLKTEPAKIVSESGGQPPTKLFHF